MIAPLSSAALDARTETRCADRGYLEPPWLLARMEGYPRRHDVFRCSGNARLWPHRIEQRPAKLGPLERRRGRSNWQRLDHREPWNELERGSGSNSSIVQRDETTWAPWASTARKYFEPSLVGRPCDSLVRNSRDRFRSCRWIAAAEIDPPYAAAQGAAHCRCLYDWAVVVAKCRRDFRRDRDGGGEEPHDSCRD